jgi:cysteine desulfurase
MYANNETGIIQPIKEIGSIAKENNIPFFCNATQAVGKIKVDVLENNIDLLCFSTHKLNAPKGVGVLYKNKNIVLTPLFHGGGQENGLRAGTYNTPLIIGIGKACEIAINEFQENSNLIETKSKLLIQELLEKRNKMFIESKIKKSIKSAIKQINL